MPRWSVCVDGTACSAPAAGTGGHHPWPPGASISVLSVQASPQADLAHGENDLSCDRLPLATWFAAIRLIATARNGISSVELGRCPVIGWPTAWTMKQKTMAVMVRREGKSRPPGRVEIDDACLRGRSCGGPCRRHKTLCGCGLGPYRGRAAQGEADVGRESLKASDRVWRQAPADPGNGGCNGRPRLLERARRGRVQPPGNPHRAGPGSGPHGTVPMIEFDSRKIPERDNGTYREVEPDSKLHSWRRSHQARALLRDHRGMTFVIKPANL